MGITTTALLGTATLAAAITAGLMVGLAGCEPPPRRAVPPPPPPPPMTVPQQRSADAAAVSSALSRYDADLARLPGHTEADHRAAAAAALTDLTAALRVAYGADPPPVFATDVSVVDAAAVTVGTAGVPRGRMEAAETQALHAAVDALGVIAMRVLFDDTDLPTLLDAAAAKADAARLSQGPLHDGDATDAFRAIGDCLHRVSADLNERFANGPMVPMNLPVRPPDMTPVSAPGATTEPTSQPTTVPTTVPTTLPTTLPTAEPTAAPAATMPAPADAPAAPPAAMP